MKTKTEKPKSFGKKTCLKNSQNCKTAKPQNRKSQCPSLYCITCTYCDKLYVGETGRRLSDRFREHLRDVERNDKDASKPVAGPFNLPNHSKQHMTINGLSLHLGSSVSCKTLEQKFISQIGTLNPHGVNERFSFN